MFINPIGAKSGITTSVSKKKKSTSNPTFKRENYLKVFDKNFNRVLQYIDGPDLDYMFRELRNATAQMKGARLASGFVEKVAKYERFRNLLLLRGTRKEDDFEALAEMSKAGPVTLAISPYAEKVVEVVNNGKFEKDNVISRMMRSANNYDVDRRNIYIEYSGLKDDRVIGFGLDYDGDRYIARGTKDNPISHSLHVFYESTGKIKEVYRNNRLRRFNMDGSEWNTHQEIVDGADEEIRKVIRFFSGWGL